MFCPPHKIRTKIRPIAETDDQPTATSDLQSSTNQPTVTSDSPSSTHRQPGCLKTVWNFKAVKIFRLVLLPFGLYLSDVITDLMLAAQYATGGDYTWFWLTLGFLLLPSIIINIWFWLMSFNNNDSMLFFSIKLLLAFLQLGAFPVYFNILYLLLRGKDVKEHVEDNLPGTHMIEAMLESIPQLCLQLYIIISTGEQVSDLKVITIVISLLAAVKAVVTLWYYVINEEDRSFSCRFVTRLILFTVWKVVEISVRVLAVGLFASAFKHWIVLPIGLQLMIMTETITCIDENTRDCLSKMLIPLFIAVDTFSMTFSMEHKRTFWMNTVLTLLGNITMVTVWYTLKTGQDWYDVPALVGVVVGSVVSAGFGFIGMVFEGKPSNQEASNEQVPDPGTATELETA